MANDNAPGGVARAIALTALRRVAPKLIPGLNLLSLAYDAYQWYRAYQTPEGWELVCGSAGGQYQRGGLSVCPPEPSVLVVTPHGNTPPAQIFGGPEWNLITFNPVPGLPDPVSSSGELTRISIIGFWAIDDALYTPGDPYPGLSATAQPMPSPTPAFPAMPPYVPYETPDWWPDQPPANDPYPMRVPDYIPYRAIPYRTGVDYWLTVRGPQVSPRPRPVPEEVDLEEIPDIRNLVKEAIKRAPLRPTRPITQPDVLPVLRSRPSVRVASRPAGRGRKELKIKVVAPAIAKLLINSATETCDFIGALFQAIPLKQRLKDKVTKRLPKKHEIDRKNPTKKMQDVGCPQQGIYVYKKLNDVAVDKAIKNLIVNELIDRSIGKANQKTNAAYVKANRGTRVGIGFGSVF